eukprot:Pgem_evm1s11017
MQIKPLFYNLLIGNVVIYNFALADILPPTNPPWDPVWEMSMSTITMQCNASGWSSPDRGATFGITSYDWSNGKARQLPLTNFNFYSYVKP